MCTRNVFLLPVLAALALGACGEQQSPESVAGPSFAPPVDPQACAPNSLNSQISGYFPGSTSGPIKDLKDAMLAASAGSDTRLNKGFGVLQAIGNLSRQQAVDTAAGATLAQGIIKCMFNVKNFPGTFPTDPVYNFSRALSANKGGAFYLRGGDSPETPVQAVVGSYPLNAPEIISGINPLDTWASALSGVQVGKALVYGYRVTGYPFNSDPFEYEWATIPPAITFIGGAKVALCDGVNPGTAMLHESNIGVLAYQDVSGVCDAGYSLTIKDTGWGPRALAARLARVVVDAMQPQPLQAAMRATGTGSTASTFKSRFKRQTVTAVALDITSTIKSSIKVNVEPVTLNVRATVDNGATGVNGVCVYLVGSNNNGTNTAIGGTEDPRCEHVDKTVNGYTDTKQVGTQLQAGWTSFTFTVNKTGNLIVTATASDDNLGTSIGVLGRDGQTFGTDQVRTNVKP